MKKKNYVYKEQIFRSLYLFKRKPYFIFNDRNCKETGFKIINGWLGFNFLRNQICDLQIFQNTNTRDKQIFIFS